MPNMRRRWRRGTGGTALMVALCVVLAGCGGGTKAGTSTGSLDRDATLRATWVVPMPSLDPHKVPSENAQFPYISLVYDRLTQMTQGADGPALAPMVATSWEFDGTGTIATFHLRDDVTFDDGTALDASAVKGSLDRALTMPGSTARAPLSMITDVAAPDKATVVITANRPAADLPYLLSNGFGSIINPKALGNPDLDVAPHGSGPYRVVQARMNDSATYARREGYWDPEAGKVRRIEIRGIPDPNARMSALRGGQSDFTLIQAQQYEQASSLGADFRVHVYPGAGNVQSIRLNPNRPHLSDVRVRQALNFAVDRQAINTSILDGLGTPTNQPLTPLYPGHLTDPPVNYTYDPQRARDLLAQAGLAGGFTMRIIVAKFSPITEISQVLQAQLKEVGITLDLVPADAVQIASQWKPGTEFDGMLQSRVNSETAAGTLSLNYLTPSGYVGTPPPDFAAAVGRANNPALSAEQQTATLKDASKIASEQAFDVFLNISPSPPLYSSRVTGGDTMGRAGYQGIFDLRYVGLTSTG